MSESYAASVVEVLREHNLIDPAFMQMTEDIISYQLRDPQDSFEFIMDDPWSARWRLRPCREDYRRVRLYYCPVMPPGSAANIELERTVNDALQALEADR